MSRRHRRRIQILALRALRVPRRHYVSLLSGAVLAVVAGLALTSGSFEVQQVAGGGDTSIETSPSPATSAAGVSSAAQPPPRQPRAQALVYLVTDEEEGKQVAATYSSLIWDQHLSTGSDARVPRVHYLVAGTPQSESEAITYLNYLIEVANLQRVDLRIIDLRPGRWCC